MSAREDIDKVMEDLEEARIGLLDEVSGDTPEKEEALLEFMDAWDRLYGLALALDRLDWGSS